MVEEYQRVLKRETWARTYCEEHTYITAKASVHYKTVVTSDPPSKWTRSLESVYASSALNPSLCI